VPELSVIICTHNPRRDYLERTLASLKAQTLPHDAWEFLLIDNASQTPLSEAWDLSWHTGSRHVREDSLGLTPARLRGIQESKGNLLLFVDDDNLLEPDFCQVLLRLAKEHPRIGCFGAGVIEPEFETLPQAELKPYLSSLALRTVSKPVWSNNPQDGIIPWGAGMGVIRQVAEAYLHDSQQCELRQNLDRRGSSLVSGGDEEFSWTACDAGYGKGLFPELKLIHLIAARRVERAYLLKLAEGQTFSQTLLAHIHGLPINLPAAPSTKTDILRHLFRAQLSQTLYHANAWWNGVHKPPIEKEFAAAWRAGIEQAQKKLSVM